MFLIYGLGESERIDDEIKEINNKVGFMALVRKKIETLCEILKSFKCQPIIFIDDLDRCTYKKAVDVLNAVNLLLANENSNFYTFLAIDPRLTVKAIESTYENTIIKAGITGFEYIDKIVQIPFAIPEQTNDDKKNFVEKMLNKINVAPPMLDLDKKSIKNQYENSDESPDEKMLKALLKRQLKSQLKNQLKTKLKIKLKNRMNPLLKNRMNPLLKNRMNPLLKNMMNPLLKNRMNPLLKNRMNPLLKNRMNPLLKNRMNPLLKNRMNPLLKNRMNPIVEKQDEPIVEKKVESLVEKPDENTIKNPGKNTENTSDCITSGIVDEDELKVFNQLSEFLDPNGRRITRIINMYMISRNYSNIKKRLLVSLKFEEIDNIFKLILSCVIFAEQWPYRLSLMIIYIEKYYNKKKYISGNKNSFNEIAWRNELKGIRIKTIYNKIQDEMYLSNDLIQLSFCDSRDDVFYSFIKLFDEFNLLQFYIVVKHFVFNLNPAIKLSILKERIKLKR